MHNNAGKTAGILHEIPPDGWECRWKTIENLWECRRKTTENLWECRWKVTGGISGILPGIQSEAETEILPVLQAGIL